MEAKLGFKPFFIQSNVWEAMKLLKERLRWRVESGRSIRVCGHKWLSKPIFYCVQSIVKILASDTRVDEQID